MKPGMIEVCRDTHATEVGAHFVLCHDPVEGEWVTYRLSFNGKSYEYGHYFPAGGQADALQNYLDRLGKGRSPRSLQAQGWLVVALAPAELPEGLTYRDKQDIANDMVAAVAHRINRSPCPD